jgi:energy-converting hydrogenase Eha subunit H
MKCFLIKFKNLLLIKTKNNILLFSTTFIFVVLILFSCTGKQGEQNKNTSTVAKEKTVWTAIDEKALNELLKSFNSTKDISNNIVWYSHKAFRLTKPISMQR